MARKNSKGKPTRKDIESTISLIGQKLQYLENYTVANERVFDLFLEFKGIKDDFIKYMDETLKKKNEKVVEKPEEKIETVEFEISDDLFLKVAKAAHDRDITFNTMVNIIMKKSIEDLEYRFDNDPKPAFLTEDN